MRAARPYIREAAETTILLRSSLTPDGIFSTDIQRKFLEHIVDRAGLMEAPRLDKIFDYSVAVKVRNELRGKGWKP